MYVNRLKYNIEYSIVDVSSIDISDDDILSCYIVVVNMVIKIIVINERNIS